MSSSSSRIAAAEALRARWDVIGRWTLAVAATVGLAIALTACSTDVRKLSCKDLNGNPGAVNAMAKVAITTRFQRPFIACPRNSSL